jgi:hypothetical protein
MKGQIDPELSGLFDIADQRVGGDSPHCAVCGSTSGWRPLEARIPVPLRRVGDGVVPSIGSACVHCGFIRLHSIEILEED